MWRIDTSASLLSPSSRCPYPHGLDCRTSFDWLGRRAADSCHRLPSWRGSISFVDGGNWSGRICRCHCTGLARACVVVARQQQAIMDHTSHLDPLGSGVDRLAGFLLRQPGQASAGRTRLRFCGGRCHASAGRLAESPGRALAANEAILIAMVEKRTLRPIGNRRRMDGGTRNVGSGLVAWPFQPTRTGLGLEVGSRAADTLVCAMAKLHADAFMI